MALSLHAARIAAEADAAEAAAKREQQQREQAAAQQQLQDENAAFATAAAAAAAGPEAAFAVPLSPAQANYGHDPAVATGIPASMYPGLHVATGVAAAVSHGSGHGPGTPRRRRSSDVDLSDPTHVQATMQASKAASAMSDTSDVSACCVDTQGKALAADAACSSIQSRLWSTLHA